MATAIKRNVGLRDCGRKAVIPNNDVARLMYYLQSVSVSCGLDVIQDDLVDYKNYFRLSQRRADQVFEAAYQFSPDEFHKKTIFLDESGELCGSSWNTFLEITDATEFLHLESEVLIAGKQTKVRKIMVFKQAWLDTYYLKPMQRNVDRLQRSLVASRSNHCQHCPGNAGKCVCKECPRTSSSKCSQTLSLTSLIGALAIKLEESAEAEKLKHCSHCKGLDATCGCKSGCPRSEASQCYVGHCTHCKGMGAPCGCEDGCTKPLGATCLVIHKNVKCDSCGKEEIRGTRFKCSECPNFDLCTLCYGSNRHGEHAFLQIDRVGCKPTRRTPRTQRKQPTAAPAVSSSASAKPKGFFYFSMSPSELKAYLNANGVSHDDCFEKQDLQRRAWECHADSLSGPELVAFMAENTIVAPPSDCRSIAGRRECLKKAFKIATRPREPAPSKSTGEQASFVEGQRVALHGLQAKHMNGKCGTVKEPVTTAHDRALVAVDGVESSMLIKYVNLRAVPKAAFLD